ncbi:hypothetical protein DENSPDRAFT_887038 [Dentipellis sp. KUC8613]|nr:hypothetical protein DENSPDRAFT_887038 [Dentipellis sp. KUC8613]
MAHFSSFFSFNMASLILSLRKWVHDLTTDPRPRIIRDAEPPRSTARIFFDNLRAAFRSRWAPIPDLDIELVAVTPFDIFETESVASDVADEGH